MLLLAAWTPLCLGIGCVAAGSENENGTPIFERPWTPLGWAFTAGAIGVFVWLGLAVL